MAQPLMALIRRQAPEGRIDVLAPPHVGPVFGAMAEVDDVIEAPNQHGKLQWRERWQLARRLRPSHYDRCYVLPNSAKSALVPFLAGIPERIGHHGEARYWLINRRRVSGPRERPMVEFYADLAFEPGHEAEQAPDPLLARDASR